MTDKDNSIDKIDHQYLTTVASTTRNAGFSSMPTIDILKKEENEGLVEIDLK